MQLGQLQVRHGERDLDLCGDGICGAGGICVWDGGFIMWCCPCAPSRPFAQCCNLSVVTVNRCGPMPGCRPSSACASLSGTGVRGVGTGHAAAPDHAHKHPRVMATAMEGELGHLAWVGCTRRQPRCLPRSLAACPAACPQVSEADVRQPPLQRCRTGLQLPASTRSPLAANRLCPLTARSP